MVYSTNAEHYTLYGFTAQMKNRLTVLYADEPEAERDDEAKPIL